MLYMNAKKYLLLISLLFMPKNTIIARKNKIEIYFALGLFHRISKFYLEPFSCY